MNKDFWKQPYIIASAVAVICFFLFPYFKISFMGISASSTGLDLAKSGIDILLWLIPVAGVYLIYAAYKGTSQFVEVAKWVLFVVAAFFWLRYAFLMDGAKIKYVGFGMWLTLLAAIFVRFESFIMTKINQQKGD